MPAPRRTARDERRRRLGQNFLRPDIADHFVDDAAVRPGELVVEIGAGAGAITRALARRGADIVAVELDPVYAARLRAAPELRDVHVLTGDFLALRLPSRSFRVIACPPFGATTAILERLLSEPRNALTRLDLIVQWEVACKRSTTPAATLRSAAWAPWWEFGLGRRVAAKSFRPVPRVDGGVLVVTRRDPPLLPPAMAARYAAFVRSQWPFATAPSRARRRR